MIMIPTSHIENSGTFAEPRAPTAPRRQQNTARRDGADASLTHQLPHHRNIAAYRLRGTSFVTLRLSVHLA